MKYNDTFFVVVDSESNRAAVRRCIEKVTQRFAFRADRPAAKGLGFQYESGAGAERQYVNVSILKAEYGFNREDVRDLELFASRLNRPGESDGAARYLTNRFAVGARSLLSGYAKGTNLVLQLTLVSNLNVIIYHVSSNKGTDGSIYEQERFANVSLSGETLSVLNQKPVEPSDVVKLNRMLLQDAFPRELARTRGNDEIRVIFGEVNVSGKRTKKGLEIEKELKKELAEALGDGIRIEQRRGWIP